MVGIMGALMTNHNIDRVQKALIEELVRQRTDNGDSPYFDEEEIDGKHCLDGWFDLRKLAEVAIQVAAKNEGGSPGG